MGGDSSHFNPAGPVDTNTGMIFYPATEGPRLRNFVNSETQLSSSLFSARSVVAIILHASDA